jgi:AbrB family looped-hinge helix DNA binding protein
MYKAKVTSKGQITIPRQVRDAMGLKATEKVAFFEVEDGEFIVRRVGSIMEMEGCLAGFAAPKTDEEMNRLISAYAAELDEATKSGATALRDGELA